MVPHCTEGGNSLLLRAISSQNKNISFRRKSQINTGFAWSGFYLPKNCYFPAHFIRWMRDGSWELGKMSFMRAHTHPISLTGSRSLKNADSPSFFLFPPPPFVLLPHTHTQNIPYVHIQYIHMRVFHPTSANGLLFSAPPLHFWHQRGLLTLGWARLTSPHCCVKFSHQWRVYLVW